jgi:hypothetical protein
MVPAVPPARNCASMGFDKFYEAIKGNMVSVNQTTCMILEAMAHLTVQAAEELIGRVVDGKLRHLAQKHRTHSLEETVAPTLLANQVHETASTPLVWTLSSLHLSDLHDPLDALDHLAHWGLHHAGVSTSSKEVSVRQRLRVLAPKLGYTSAPLSIGAKNNDALKISAQDHKRHACMCT